MIKPVDNWEALAVRPLKKEQPMPKRRTINSRAKGAGGERELANFLDDHGFPANRGQQHAGSPDSPDIKCPALTSLGLHIECKRVEAGNLYSWLKQAIRDAGSKIPVVMHRRNKEEWVVVLRLKDFLKLLKWMT